MLLGQCISILIHHKDLELSASSGAVANRRSRHFHGGRIRVKVSNLQEVDGQLFLPSSCAGCLPDFIMITATLRGRTARSLCSVQVPPPFSCRASRSRHSPSSLSFLHVFWSPPLAVLVKPGNSLLNYRGREEGRERRRW